MKKQVSQNGQVSQDVDRQIKQRREPLHQMMEAFFDAMAPLGRPHLREKTGRLRPLYDWCLDQGIDPVTATEADLGRFRSWIWDDWRNVDSSVPAYNTKRHVFGISRMWYRWLQDAGHRRDDPARKTLAMKTDHKGPPARFIHAELHPLMESHLDYQRLRGREKTAQAVNLALRQFSFWCAQKGIDPIRLTKDQADAYLVWISTETKTPAGNPLSRQTIDMRIAYIRSFYNWLEERGRIVANPTAKLVVKVTKSRVVVREHLSLQEAIALVQTQAEQVAEVPAKTLTWAKRMRFLTAICMGLATGRRIGGLLSIKVDDLDQERLELRVDKEKGITGRVLPVAEWAVAIAKAYIKDARPLLAAGRDLPWLFVGSDGPLSHDSLNSALDDLVKQTIAKNPDLEELPNKTITWHSLRVTFATMLFGNGCPIRSVNELMLHRCLSTTAKYTPIPIEDMQAIWKTAHPRG